MLTSLVFIQPLWFILLLPIYALMYWLWKQQSDKGITEHGVIASHLAKVFSVQGGKKSSIKPIMLTLLVVTLIITALASPSINLSGQQKSEKPLLIAIDLSDSMLQKQGSVSHLDRAKLIISQLLKRGFDRPIGLIAFAGSAHQVLPVSEQLELLGLYLGYLDPSVMPEQGSDLNQLLISIDQIAKTKPFGYDLLIVSDGVDVDKSAFNSAIDNLGKQQSPNIMFVALTEQAEKQTDNLDVELLTGKYLDSGDDSLYRYLLALSKNDVSKLKSLTPVGYWLLYPVLLIVLYFFRRGFNLHWAMLMLLCISIKPSTVEAAFIDWWMTADQQGAYYFNQQNYQQAALSFEDKNWKAASYVYAKEYKKAAAIYEKQSDLTSLYNLAVANTKGRNYHRAQRIYQLIVEIQPDNHDAQNNLRIISSLIKEIQLTSENQQEEAPPSENTNSEDMNDQELAAERDQIGQMEVKLEGLSAEEVLGSEQKKQQWLRDISRDPKQFLGAKFQAQYMQQQNQQSQVEVENDQ